MASAAIMIGYDSAFIGTTIALDSFRDEFGLTDVSTEKKNLLSANIVSCYQAGAFFGAFFAYPFSHFYGRKVGLQIFSTVFIVGAGLMCGANGDRGLGLIYGGRVLAGIGVGGASNLSPIYVSEISPPAIRGRLYGLTETMAPSHKQWLIPFAVQLIPAGLLLFGSFLVRESPRWLFSRSNREQGLRNLCWLRQLDSQDIYMMEEVASIDAALEYQRSTIGLGFWQPFRAVLRDKKILYRFFIGGALFFWQNASGINAVNYYSPTIFKSIGVQGTNTSLLTTGIFGVIKTVVTIVWLLFLVDKLGRRNLLFYGAVGGSIAMWYIGAYIKIADLTHHPSDKLGNGGISAMAFFYIWTIFYTPTWNGTPWVYNSEIFDQSVRTLAQAFAAANNWLWNFLVARFTPQMFSTMGYGVYFFFASLMLLSTIFVYFCLPETKGVPLESMDRLFARELPARKVHQIVFEELRRDEEEFRGNAEGAGLSASKEEYAEKGAHFESV
ncbi:putative quinate permease [Phaeomoniella chlamydospora]|uniref:Quinate transporter n=1 Tax=Phaeomoniella chlamydospora TaxID=158046 RepID=A0A0G2DY29_PHACM|nr:putative quinate permease [Phaeomoniella chlamydospora]